MNPYESILTNVYGDDCDWKDMHGMDSAAILVLRILADNYKGDMPLGTCCDTYRWCLAQLSKYKPNELVDFMEHDWAQIAPSLYD